MKDTKGKKNEFMTSMYSVSYDIKTLQSLSNVFLCVCSHNINTQSRRYSV